MERKRNVLLLTGGIALAGVLAVWLINKGLRVDCVFYGITGLDCPGCGNTRAVLALLRLDLKGMLEYNLMFPLELGYLAWVYLASCRGYIKTGRFSYGERTKWLDISVLAIVLIWGVVRNVLGW